MLVLMSMGSPSVILHLYSVQQDSTPRPDGNRFVLRILSRHPPIAFPLIDQHRDRASLNVGRASDVVPLVVTAVWVYTKRRRINW